MDEATGDGDDDSEDDGNDGALGDRARDNDGERMFEPIHHVLQLEEWLVKVVEPKILRKKLAKAGMDHLLPKLVDKRLQDTLPFPIPLQRGEIWIHLVEIGSGPVDIPFQLP